MITPDSTPWEMLDPISAPSGSELYKNNTISEDMSVEVGLEGQPQPPYSHEYTRSYPIHPKASSENKSDSGYLRPQTQERNHMLVARQPRRQLAPHRERIDSEQTQQETSIQPPYEQQGLPYQPPYRTMPELSISPEPVNLPWPYSPSQMPVAAPPRDRQRQHSSMNQGNSHMVRPNQGTIYPRYQSSSGRSSPTIWPQDRNAPSSQRTISLSEAKSLRAQISYLQEKVIKLEGKPIDIEASKYQILYRIENDNISRGMYLRMDSDEDFKTPWMGTFTDPPERYGLPRLRCNDRLANFELYLALNKDISFVVFRNFKRTVERHSLRAKYGKPEPFSENILPVSEYLKEIFEEMLSGREFKSMYSGYQASREVKKPYLFVYHNRSKVADMREGLSSAAQQQLDLFMDYVQATCGEEYAVADSLLNKGRIRPEYVPYLFKPNDVLISKDNNEYTGYLALDWPFQDERYFGSEKSSLWRVRGQTWEFDGKFCRRWDILEFQTSETQLAANKSQNRRENPIDDPMLNSYSQKAAGDSPSAESNSNKECAITDLAVFPIKHASSEIFQMLQRRGETFWKLRGHRYVSYHATEEENFQTMADDRYIIDMKTYKRLHPPSNVQIEYKSLLDDRAMARESPPDETFQFLMPPRIVGFNLRRKKWFKLCTDRISDVVWNKEAFKSLALESKSRDLIQALVTNHIEAEYSADLIAGKGNGLILLLHGGPGTGKTLTAESVAEIAERPLYRVTCGDVGTKPEEVEKYLESVLHLGKIWNCVVLLDEADVFLEQRGMEDLNRNALVSSFLRVVEYFEGILILTTNRVGTFDEAFKSRIQLALHYPSLDEDQRRLIWEAFMERLWKSEPNSVNIHDLRMNLDVLKKESLNGRQIRNCITTARQYAKWQKTFLTYEQVKDVIQVSARFDAYLENLHRPSTQT
ncbi:uncharacterized protein N7511_001589 [Penicillium nucicola]|uniref:uncharacterized protein n=1 Tax=Penicillium nucicola TaxID=1850975 RepID=UPI0025451B1D|nr:uncharacterized protein N7511_001589 [Penicillium nucicola]KAJ5776578.1 hypothetical protein N7511_001589 [Penicillium nucicola]